MPKKEELFIALLGTLKNKGDMARINIIDNVAIKNGRLRVIDSLGREKRAFLEQGNLEGECAVYSLMMMLIVHDIIDDHDLIMENSRVSANVKQLRKQFLYKRRVRGYSLKVLQKNSSMSLVIKFP